MKIYLSIVTLI